MINSENSVSIEKYYEIKKGAGFAPKMNTTKSYIAHDTHAMPFSRIKSCTFLDCSRKKIHVRITRTAECLITFGKYFKTARSRHIERTFPKTFPIQLFTDTVNLSKPSRT